MSPLSSRRIMRSRPWTSSGLREEAPTSSGNRNAGRKLANSFSSRRSVSRPRPGRLSRGPLSSPGVPTAPNRMASALRASSSVAGGSGTPAAATPAAPIGASLNLIAPPATACSTPTASAVTSLPIPSPGMTAMCISRIIPRSPMAKNKAAAKQPTPDDVDPKHRWDRPLQAPGRTQVDFEERVDFRRLHEYRLARTRPALAQSNLGALLVFDQYNIRYVSSTVIGEWARDKLTRWCLLTGNGEPWVWDFGSAARHHRLYAPWIPERQSLAGLAGMRGAVSPKAGLFARAAQEIKGILAAEGVAGMPLGVDLVEPPFLFALQEAGLEVRDGQQVMLEARMLKSQDELTLLNMAAAMVDGVYQDIWEALKPGVRENEIVALATKRLYEMGSDCVEGI